MLQHLIDGIFWELEQRAAAAVARSRTSADVGGADSLPGGGLHDGDDDDGGRGFKIAMVGDSTIRVSTYAKSSLANLHYY